MMPPTSYETAQTVPGLDRPESLTRRVEALRPPPLSQSKWRGRYEEFNENWGEDTMQYGQRPVSGQQAIRTGAIPVVLDGHLTWRPRSADAHSPTRDEVLTTTRSLSADGSRPGSRNSAAPRSAFLRSTSRSLRSSGTPVASGSPLFVGLPSPGVPGSPSAGRSGSMQCSGHSRGRSRSPSARRSPSVGSDQREVLSRAGSRSPSASRGLRLEAASGVGTPSAELDASSNAKVVDGIQTEAKPELVSDDEGVLNEISKLQGHLEKLWSFASEIFSVEEFGFSTSLQYFDGEKPSDPSAGDVESGRRPKAKKAAPLFSTQYFPKFILVHTSLVLVLWFGFSFSARDANTPWSLTKAGLDSIWPEKTDLRIGIECEDNRAQIWRWLTYQYTHMGTSHVMMNAALNLLLGVPVEGFHGTLRTIIMYNAGVFGGACCNMLFDVHHPAVGMSGGCYALIGMHLGCIALNWRQRPYRWAKLFFIFLCALADILNAYFAVSSGDGMKVSHSIHFGGWISGLLSCVLVGRNLVVKRWEKMAWWAALFLAFVMATFCISWGMVWAPKTLFESSPWCWSRQVNNFKLFGTTEWQCVRCHTQECINKWSSESHIVPVSIRSCDLRGGWRVSEP